MNLIELLMTAAVAAVLAYDVFVALIDPEAKVFPSVGF